MIIAEFCQNHNGDRNILEGMIKAASHNGAQYAKIQSIMSEDLTFRPQFEKGLKSEDGKILSIKRPFQEEFDRLKKLELNDLDVKNFISLCKDYNLIPLTTCFARKDIKKLKRLGFNSIKVASYDCASYKMLSELADEFSELIISTGATFDREIEYAANLLTKKNSKFSFLHCVTIYPTPLFDVNLSRMNWLSQFTNNVGFSDHTLVEKDGVLASKCALALGAKLIERHFTILDKDQTKDGPVSINEKLLKELSDFSKLDNDKQIEELNKINLDLIKIKGIVNRELSEIEMLNRDYYRGRFASHITKNKKHRHVIYNWEETPIIYE